MTETFENIHVVRIRKEEDDDETVQTSKCGYCAGYGKVDVNTSDGHMLLPCPRCLS